MNEEAYRSLTGFELKSQFHNWKSLCPVHSEKTPSFYIHKDTYLCHCFGCGAKGYIDNVLAKALEITPGLVRKHLDIPIIIRSSEPVTEELPSFEQSWLAGFPRIQSHPFLTNRGFMDDTILSHEVRWDSDKTRLVFPYRSLGGLPEGAMGRTVVNEIPKWYTYWRLQKGELLYSIHTPSRYQPLIIVEGIFDVMWLNQMGYHNTVGVVTAQVSKNQVMLIKQHANEVILFLDNDKAGRIGQDFLANALRTDLKVSCAVYPENRKDPQELTRDEIYQAIESRQTRVEYLSSR